jgi:hypothetical protein
MEPSIDPVLGDPTGESVGDVSLRLAKEMAAFPPSLRGEDGGFVKESSCITDLETGTEVSSDIYLCLECLLRNLIACVSASCRTAKILRCTPEATAVGEGSGSEPRLRRGWYPPWPFARRDSSQLVEVEGQGEVAVRSRTRLPCGGRTRAHVIIACKQT